MRRIYFAILVSLAFTAFFTSCHSSEPESTNQEVQVPTAEDIALKKKEQNDSLMIALDSLYKINIYIPPLYDKENFDSATTIKFFELTKATQGELKLLVNSKYISGEIINIIQSHAEDGADILFLIDKTGSMEDDIDNVKKGLNQIVKSISAYDNIRLGIALYGDKNFDGSDWFSFRNFETNYTAAKSFINGISVTSGGDLPESVYEGFFSSMKQNFWKSGRKRMIILIGDAPPQEKPNSEYGIKDVIRKATADSIYMNFYPIVVTPTIDGSVMKVKTYEKSKIITTLYPNPSSGIVNVTFEKDGEYSAEIYNSSGALILSENVSGKEWRKDLSDKASGAYILRIIDKDKKFETSKFVIAR